MSISRRHRPPAGASPLSSAHQPALPLRSKRRRVSALQFDRAVALGQQFARERDTALAEVRRLTKLLDKRKPGWREAAPRNR